MQVLKKEPGDRLNFFPYYEDLLKRRLKTKTIRLGDESWKYKKGQVLNLTCGWNESQSLALGRVMITGVWVAPISSLKDSDLDGESPDCLTTKAVPYVLSAIYRQIVSPKDTITMLQWAFVD